MSVPKKEKGLMWNCPAARTTLIVSASQPHTGAHTQKSGPLPSRAVVKRNLGNATKIKPHRKVQVQGGWTERKR